MKKKSKESKKRVRVFRNSRTHKGNDLINNGKSMYGDEDKSFRKRQAHFATSLSESKQSLSHFCCCTAKIRIFSSRCFFYRRKVLTGRRTGIQQRRRCPSISLGYASYLQRVRSVVPVCQFFLKDARQRVCSVVVLVGIKVAQKRRYMLIKTLVPLFPTERHYN